ncbi:MAG: alpha/beta hydrolase [Gemmatimonadota bacterium]
MTVDLPSGRFFGDAPDVLFGVFHAGSGEVVRDTGILLCHAAPQEYSIVYWIVRQLALDLASAGFPVLRFDYHATGDSTGAAGEASLTRWVSDIGAAAEELRRASGVRRIGVVGMRLGGALAVRAIAAGLEVRDLVLWDPVVSGTEYVTLMERVDRRVHAERHYPENDLFPHRELFGYPFDEAMRRETESVNLLTEPLGQPRRMLVVSHGDNARHTALMERATREGIAAAHEVVDVPPLYADGIAPQETLFAHAAKRAIRAFLASRR